MKSPGLITAAATVPLFLAASSARLAASTDALPQAVPSMMSPTHLASGGAAIITGLLLLLNLFRRSPYIPAVDRGWACLALSFGIDPSGQSEGAFNALTAAGSQFLMVAAGLCFVTAANAYRRDSRVPRVRAAVVFALAAWFVLAALAWGSAVVFVSGYALTGARPHGRGDRARDDPSKVRMLGAALVGAALTIAAATNAWMVLSPVARGGPALSDAFFVELALYLVTALGMQLMTFEDMTYELKSANHSCRPRRSSSGAWWSPTR